MDARKVLLLSCGDSLFVEGHIKFYSRVFLSPIPWELSVHLHALIKFELCSICKFLNTSKAFGKYFLIT